MIPIRTLVFLSIAIVGLYVASSACGKTKSNARPPAAAGQFYPSDPDKLKLAIQQFLNGAAALTVEKPIAIIVPHAGYIFAGQVYADAYRQVMRRHYDVAVILGTNHTAKDLKGIALYPSGAYHTPLGDAAIDESVTSALLAEDNDCTADPEAHAREHSIEVQVPFVQVLFPNAKIVAAVIHPPDIQMCTRFGQALAKTLRGRQTLIVISSDLSHYPAYKDAVRVDRQTIETIVKLDPEKFASTTVAGIPAGVPNLETRACGAAPILAGVAAAKALGATHAVVAGYSNSGDVAVGDRSRVVGYGAIVLAAGEGSSDLRALDRPPASPTADPLQVSDKRTLLAFARETIKRYLTTSTVPPSRGFSPRLNYPQGAFVTLRENGKLRGCIGHIPADNELGKTVGAMAVEAAFNDSRFRPVELSEMKELEIEISVLTPMKPVAGPDEIRVGRDGVVIVKAGRSAVFLPQVAVENNWDRTEMLDQLCIKAGLPAGGWQRDAQFYVFQAEVFSESEFR